MQATSNLQILVANRKLAPPHLHTLASCSCHDLGAVERSNATGPSKTLLARNQQQSLKLKDLAEVQGLFQISILSGSFEFWRYLLGGGGSVPVPCA